MKNIYENERDAALVETQVSSQKIYDGKIIHVYCDEVELPDGKRAPREVIRHNGAVCIVPINDKGEVVCVRQYRYAVGKLIIEIPAGKLDSKDEDPMMAALRELREETGYTCGKLTYIGDMYGSPAILDEVIHMYIAEELFAGENDLDEDEFLEPLTLPLDTLADMIMSGEIRDAKTQIAVMKAFLYKNKFKK